MYYFSGNNVNRLRILRPAEPVRTVVGVNELHERLENAIAENLLEVHYEPQIDLESTDCTHLEALVRWTDKEMGAISPAVFIPLAEELDLIDEITRQVIDRVQGDIGDWRSEGVPIDSVAVNISAKLFSTPERAQNLVDVLTNDNRSTGAITLELTETAVMQHKEITLEYLRKLKELGFELALDDFGTGYSSLSYLLDYPIDMVKIDRSFISTLNDSAKGRAIVRSILEMSKELNIKTVAEGVERVEQLWLLKQMHCQFVQGYLLSKAVPANVASHRLRRGNPSAA
ncbi:MAG TPA: EAL domain-containing protein [Planktothrix sp.]|jgi:EAL domain-containing protein (putative c-di-GMP-specific phosphodiesterase class I)